MLVESVVVPMLVVPVVLVINVVEVMKVIVVVMKVVLVVLVLGHVDRLTIKVVNNLVYCGNCTQDH